jgi:hypothetical protein
MSFLCALRSGEPHEILGVSPDADEAAVRSAFRSLCRLWHPDKQAGNTERASEGFQLVNAAKESMLSTSTLHVTGPERCRAWASRGTVCVALRANGGGGGGGWGGGGGGGGPQAFDRPASLEPRPALEPPMQRLQRPRGQKLENPAQCASNSPSNLGLRTCTASPRFKLPRLHNVKPGPGILRRNWGAPLEVGSGGTAKELSSHGPLRVSPVTSPFSSCPRSSSGWSWRGATAASEADLGQICLPPGSKSLKSGIAGMFPCPYHLACAALGCLLRSPAPFNVKAWWSF